jgi:transposase InsO family protein
VILKTIDEAIARGARVEEVCPRLGYTVRTIQRWRKTGSAEDRRVGPKRSPANKLTATERRRILKLVNSQEFRDLSPKQIVPRLADKGIYVASESSIYRLLRKEGLLAHRASSRPATKRPKVEHVASAPNRVWSWDITYLRGPVRGSFLYLYLVVDVFSRRIMGWDVSQEESMDKASELIQSACMANTVDPNGLVLHSDNGGPMKGSTMLRTLQWLGIVPSFSRPRVSDDNAFSEALFRTLKYRPGFPANGFESLDAARAWVDRFVGWYNGEHRHSAIKFVTPNERHFGKENAILARRSVVYEKAKAMRPERWARATRDWTPAGAVRLNPLPCLTEEQARSAAA